MGDWKERLQPFAEIFVEYENRIRDAVGYLGTDDILALVEACDQPTETNCWYAIYDSKDLVRTVARTELSVRS